MFPFYETSQSKSINQISYISDESPKSSNLGAVYPKNWSTLVN